MEFFVGLDVSLDETHFCVVDEGGRIVKEGRCPSDPQALARSIRHKGRKIEHLGLETGGLSQWLYDGLTKEEFSVSVMEARHVRAAFAAMRVKTDRNDARGIAQLVRLGWFKRVHVKSLDAQETRALLTMRAFLVEKVTATENSLRAALRNFGLRMGAVTRPNWDARAWELATGQDVLEQIVEAMLRVRSLLLAELATVEGRLVALAKADPVTRLLMTVPGVGVVVALSFRSAVDDPVRFRRTRDVGSWLGLTPRRWQSGKTDIVGRITKGAMPACERCSSRRRRPFWGACASCRP
jgi:transposase